MLVTPSGILLSLLKDEDRNVRSSAAEALAKLGHANPEVVSMLLSFLGDKYPRLTDAASALTQLAKTSDIICPEVVQWLKQNANHDEIGSAIDCLWSIVVE